LNKTRGPRLTANTNSVARWATCRHAKLVYEVTNIMNQINCTLT
jgi:hypothetical protein